MTERTSAGDPARTLELLWRKAAEPAPARGPRRGLSVDAVVDAAIALADAEGLPAVSMRRLAGELGVAAMTLYTYVPGKAELIDLMLDTLYARMGRGCHTGKSVQSVQSVQPWRARLEEIARANLALFAAHPWAAAVSTARPPLGPGLMAKYERELQALEGLGLDDVEMDAALTFLLGFVQASARAAAEARAGAHESRMDDAAWWQANAPLLARVLDPAAYPTASRVGSAAGAAHGAAFDPDHAFEFGLQRVLDGLAALIAAKASPGSGP
jgi:AcrR family transcriptional regulator